MKQSAKTGKFTCVICNHSQSVQKIILSSQKPSELTPNVQKLNEAWLVAGGGDDREKQPENGFNEREKAMKSYQDKKKEYEDFMVGKLSPNHARDSHGFDHSDGYGQNFNQNNNNFNHNFNQNVHRNPFSGENSSYNPTNKHDSSGNSGLQNHWGQFDEDNQGNKQEKNSFEYPVGDQNNQNSSIHYLKNSLASSTMKLKSSSNNKFESDEGRNNKNNFDPFKLSVFRGKKEEPNELCLNESVGRNRLRDYKEGVLQGGEIRFEKSFSEKNISQNIFQNYEKNEFPKVFGRTENNFVKNDNNPHFNNESFDQHVNNRPILDIKNGLYRLGRFGEENIENESHQKKNDEDKNANKIGSSSAPFTPASTQTVMNSNQESSRPAPKTKSLFGAKKQSK